MKNKIQFAACFILIYSTLVLLASAQGTAFTYHGRLNDGANPANGSYDLRFTLYDMDTGGSQQGPTLTNSTTAISNGLFTVTLDFGSVFPGAARYLEIAVRTKRRQRVYFAESAPTLDPNALCHHGPQSQRHIACRTIKRQHLLEQSIRRVCGRGDDDQSGERVRGQFHRQRRGHDECKCRHARRLEQFELLEAQRQHGGKPDQRKFHWHHRQSAIGN